MPSSCGKRRSEELDLDKIKSDNKIRVAVNLHHHAHSTCESSSNIRLQRMSSEDFFEPSPTKVIITRKKPVTVLPKRTKKLPDPPAPMPVPCNYSSYTASCRTQFLSKSGREKSRYIKKLISKGYMFSIGRVQMYDLFRDHSNGTPITDWKTRGRKPILSCGRRTRGTSRLSSL